jgi:glutathione S-transferase
LSRWYSLVGARLTSWLRAGAGGRVVGAGARPEAPLVLYEFEACPFCRRVREALTRLDLEVTIKPCPKGGTRFRDELLRLGGREQFPFLVDVGAGRSLYESSDIVAHLEARYGAADGAQARTASRGVLATAALVASGLGRGAAGGRARPSRAADQPLVFAGYEAQPESRLVREVLCELELAYSSRPSAPGSARRGGDGAGRHEAALPRLFDPNVAPDLGATFTGWSSIVDHLERTYALGPVRR